MPSSLQYRSHHVIEKSISVSVGQTVRYRNAIVAMSVSICLCASVYLSACVCIRVCLFVYLHIYVRHSVSIYVCVRVPVASDGSRIPHTFTLEVPLHPVTLLVCSDRRRDRRGVWLQWLLVAVLPAHRYLQNRSDQIRTAQHGRGKHSATRTWQRKEVSECRRRAQR